MLGDISNIIKTIVRKTGATQKRKYVRLVGNKKTIKYDGCSHQVNGFITEEFSVDNKRYSVKYDSYETSGINAGCYYPELKGKLCIYNSRGIDVTNRFDIEIIPGELFIEKRELILQSASGIHEYDGCSYELNTVEISGDGFASEEGFRYCCKGSLYLPGEVNNQILYSVDEKTNLDNYNVHVEEGILKVIDRKIPYTITLEYPEKKHVYTGEKIVDEQPSEEKIEVNGISYIVKNIDVVASGKNVGEYDYVIRSAPRVYNEKGDELTKQFSVEYKLNNMKIIPKSIVLMSNSGRKIYDGKPLIAEGLLIDGLIETDSIKYKITGKQCDVGISENYFDYYFEPDILATNYIVEKKYGILKVEELKANTKLDIPSIDYILDNDECIKTNLKELYHIDELEHGNKTFVELEFTKRVINRLQGNLGIFTLGELLNLTYEKLMTLKGFGRTSIIGVDESLRKISKKDCPSTVKGNSLFINPSIRYFLREHIEQIYQNNYEFCKNSTFNDNEQLVIDTLKEATNLLDKELIVNTIEKAEHIVPIMNMLNSIVSKYDRKEEIRKQIKKEYNQISDNKHDCHIKWFIYAYTDDDSKRTQMLTDFEQKNIRYIKDIIKANFIEDDSLQEILNFIKWCGFDVQKEAQAMLNKLYKNYRECEVIANRAAGNTLDITGKVFGVTRERVRQIEKKVTTRFESLLESNRIILKVFAERDGDEILTPSELLDYFGEYAEQILYLLRRSDTTLYTYDSDLDVFVVGSSGLAERAQAYIDKLPEVFSEDQCSDIIKRGIEEYNLTEEIILAHIDSEYKKTEKLYHRSRLTLQSIYDATLKKYYPEGLWVYGVEDILGFRAHIKNDYGNIILPEKDRALVAQICRAAVLCGRGKYKAKQLKYVSAPLLKKIEKFIDTSESTVILMNTIFNVFEDELRAENIDNKYYLQGILHETFGKKWCFRRDYVSKDETITSLNTEIVSYIKNAGYPVKKQEIQNKYPGITEIVLNVATSDPKILNLFGCYLHGDNLNLSKADISYLKEVVEQFLKEKDSWHCRMLYEYIMQDNPIVLKKNYINFPFGIYSLLEYCFREEYNFSRPYIAKNGSEITRTFEALQEMIQDSDTMEVADISLYARKNFHQIGNILEFLDSCNDTHFLISSSEIASIDIIGIKESDVIEIEAILKNEVVSTMPISNLKCVHAFPKINISWNEWLIYSAIKRWGKKYEVQASESQLKQAVPLIAPKGEMSISNLENMDVNSELTVADDLNDIDKLIENYALEELELDEL